MRRFCARCGRPEEPGRPLIGSLCLDCYLEEKGLARLPGEIVVTMCPRCGSLRVQGAWLPPEPGGAGLESVVEAEMLARARPNPEVEQMWVEELEVEMHGGSRGTARARLAARLVGGVEARLEVAVPVRMVHVLCPACMR
ncbi:MAG: NMD3-related protein, partial [Candidatus Korarchaeota archaeon]|nr:NMD3-related protein [Candidatus Korarchaeota archaeon]